MEFTVQRNDILPPIQFVNSIVPISNPLQILTNILIEADAEKNRITMAATDLEVTAVVELDCEVKQSGKIAVSAQNITDIIRSLPEDKINFTTTETMVEIKCFHSDFQLLYTDTSDFPEIPSRDWNKSFKIDANLFSKMIEKTSIAVSEQIGRPAFSGILWELDNENQILIATDGKRLSKFETKFPLNIKNPSKIVMPIKGLNLIRKIIKEKSKEINILPEESSISFGYDSYKIFSRLIEVKYPDYEAVIPYNNSKIVEIDVESFKNAVHRVSILSSEDTNKVVLNFSGKKLNIYSEDIEKGSAEEFINIEGNVDSFQIGFNYKYLSQILQHIDTEKVKMKLENTLDPALFYNTEYPENEENFFLLMPLRLSSD